MPISTCTKCLKPVPLGESRCVEHKPKRVHKRTTKQRGYGAKHEALRKQLINDLNNGKEFICWRCEQRIVKGQRVDLGHDETNRNLYKGLEHERCNRSRKTLKDFGL